MWVINLVKVAVVWFCDLVNKLFDPFKLPPQYATTDLEWLEQLFWHDINVRFYQPSGEFLYELPRPEDAGDTALFQGLATALKILRGEDINKELDFIHSLLPNGSLIRGFYPDGRPNDTTSNDSATGIMFFFFTALWYGNPQQRYAAGAMLRTWANNLRAHNWALCDLQGKPTKFGKLEQGILTDPLRVTLLLAILAVARVYDSSFGADYAEIYNKYKPILPYARLNFLWWGKSYDAHRAAIHLHVLYKMTNDDVYRDGLLRTWRTSEKADNAWIYALCSVAMKSPSNEPVKRRLSTFSFEGKYRGSLETINNDVPTVNWPPFTIFGEEKRVRCKYALPFYKRGSQDFFWQRSMFSKDEWVGKKEPAPYHSGLDFLLCYWLAKREGLLK